MKVKVHTKKSYVRIQMVIKGSSKKTKNEKRIV